MWNTLRWLFGQNVAKKGTVYVSLNGVAFTVNGIEALVSTLRRQRQDLENQVHNLQVVNLSLQKRLYKQGQLINSYEAAAWKPPTPAQVERWWQHEAFKRVDVKNA